MKKLLMLLLTILLPLTINANGNNIQQLAHLEIQHIDTDTTKWYNRTHQLDGVTVKSRRKKYSRKNNPAVELMRKVIAAKKRTDLSNNDFYAFQKYQKITLSANDIKTSSLQEGLLSKIPGLINQVETCPFNNKLIIPVTFTETISRHIYRKHPKTEREVVIGEKTEGLNQLFQTGNILTDALKDFFTDVDIYDNQIRLLQHPFTSPIGHDAIAFYRYFIIDTLQIAQDSCIHLYFSPNNQQDFGFSGHLYILKDSTYRVKRCELQLPLKTGVNFVKGMNIVQEFSEQQGGKWALTTDDMAVELSLMSFLQKAIVVRQTRLSNYNFDTIPDGAFSLATKAEVEKKAKYQKPNFWIANRPIALTGSEQSMSSFLKDLEKGSAYKYVMAGLKLLTENFIETGSKQNPSKIDLGPVNTLLTSNFIDGFRTRISAQTTANLHPQLFLSGYYAHGWRSNKNYYKGEMTYSFNKKDYLPDEFPMRYIRLSSTYDVCAPTDKFLATDKDNVFTSLKWAKVDKMMFYHRQAISFVREERWGLRTTLAFKQETDEACGALFFRPLLSSNDIKLKTSEISLQLRYAPGEKFVNTKQRRRPLNRDVPVLTLSHTMGIKGVFGSQYKSNLTDISLFSRLWLKSWGKMDIDVKMGAQWNKVPFPLLCMPAANLSYITQYSTFGLINNMEFLNDRYAHLMITWDLNGKIFNRLPLIKRLKWREYIGVRTLWGTLTSKNNPTLPSNQQDGILMELPEGTFLMNPNRPYIEVLAGVHNVFRFFHIEYVRRLNYLDLPTAHKQGIRVKFSLKF